MKEKIQPKYNVVKVKCATCGNEFEVGSTLKEIKIDTCNQCHPFYTGKQTFVQAQGRVEQFNKKYGIKQKQEESETEE